MDSEALEVDVPPQPPPLNRDSLCSHGCSETTLQTRLASHSETYLLLPLSTVSYPNFEGNSPCLNITAGDMYWYLMSTESWESSSGHLLLAW